MPDNVLLAQYPQQIVVQRRNWMTMNSWASEVLAEEVPEERPPLEWVKLRITAGRVKTNLDQWVVRTMPFFVAVPQVQNGIQYYMNPFNPQDIENNLATDQMGFAKGFMPLLADLEVTQLMADQWAMQHGFEPFTPPPEVPPTELEPMAGVRRR
jgi:hypothetical protein